MSKTNSEKENKETNFINNAVILFILLFCYYKFFLHSKDSAKEAYTNSIGKEIKKLNPVAKITNWQLEQILLEDSASLKEILGLDINNLEDIDYEVSNGNNLLIAMAKAKDKEFIPGKRSKCSAFIKAVFDKRPNLNHQDKYGRTALIWNTITGGQEISSKSKMVIPHFLQSFHYELEAKLINMEAAKNIKDNGGFTALQYATTYNLSSYVILLTEVR